MDRKAFIARLFEKAGKDTACEASYESGSSFEVEVLNGEILRYESADSVGLGFRALANGKFGYASTQILDEDAADMLVSGALENAAVIETEDEEFLYGGGGEYEELETYNPALEQIDAAKKIEMAKELEKLTLAVDPRIVRVEGSMVISESVERALVNSKGLDVSVKGNLIGGYVGAIAQEGEKVNTGFKMFFELDPAKIDLKKVAEDAAREALAGLHGEPVDSGKYRVLLRNDVAGTMLGVFSGIFSAENAQKGLSRLKGREGEKIAAECVTIMDDPHMAGSPASTPFDGEGVPTKVKAVVEAGVLNTLLHNLKTAAKQGVETTANASRPGYASPVGVAPTNFYFKPTDVSFDGMLERVGDGLLITDLAGMHAGANPITGDFSLAAKGFRVVGGKLGDAVAQITVAGNFYDLLRNIEAVGGDFELGRPASSCFSSPSLLIRELSVAGK